MIDGAPMMSENGRAAPGGTGSPVAASDGRLPPIRDSVLDGEGRLGGLGISSTGTGDAAFCTGLARSVGVVTTSAPANVGEPGYWPMRARMEPPSVTVCAVLRLRKRERSSRSSMSPSRTTACRLSSHTFWRSRSLSSFDLYHSSRSLTICTYSVNITDTVPNVSSTALVSSAARGEVGACEERFVMSWCASSACVTSAWPWSSNDVVCGGASFIDSASDEYSCCESPSTRWSGAASLPAPRS